MQNKIKRAVAMVLILACFLLLTACGQDAETTIDGEWVLVEKVLADGSIVNKADLKEIGMSEVYVISSEEVKYTCITPQMKPITIDMKMVKSGEKEYSFYAAETLLFAVATLDGKRLSYTLGEPGDTITFIFEKK